MDRSVLKGRLGCTLFTAFFLLAGCLVADGILWNSATGAGDRIAVAGLVSDGNGPVAGATVRIQGTAVSTVTDAAGHFVLPDRLTAATVNLSAWKKGYYCALVKNVRLPARDVRLKLIRYQMIDNKKYAWLPPEGAKGSCRECHEAITEASLKDAHLGAARNPRFLTMYNGTDMAGNRSPMTSYGDGAGIWKFTQIPRRRDAAGIDYGPGYALDFPGAAGNCTFCHIPGASIPYPVAPKAVKGADTYGVHCDFCHKVADVRLNPVTQMPKAHVPGVRAMSLRRPFSDDPERRQLFFGTFDDVNADEGDTNLPLLKESRYCAACHFGVFWDTVVYNSYGEWLKSPYANPQSGKAKTCQECHMSAPAIFKGKAVTNVAPGKGGIEREPAAIRNHNMTVDAELLRNALTMDASATLQEGKVTVHVTLTNDRTGHHIPSDSPLRHLILLVEAKDSRGMVLKQLVGPKLPDWCGMETAKQGHLAGLPGKAYAKLLREKWTEVFPTGAYWNHTELVSDNRLAALAADTVQFTFAATTGEDAVVNINVLYRRAFIDLMEQKKWNVPDIVMAGKQILLREERKGRQPL